MPIQDNSAADQGPQMRKSMKEIKLHCGRIATVDDDDFYFISQYKWCFMKGGYARSVWTENGKQKTILMHRLIMNPSGKEIIDHVDMNGLNNCRSNLRISNKSTNAMNRRKQSGNWTSKYKGVSFIKKPWVASITVSNKQISLGCFKTELEAAKAYDNAAKKYHKEFARLNLE
jgi:hypothetical protein